MNIHSEHQRDKNTRIARNYFTIALSLLVALGLVYLAVPFLTATSYGVYPVQTLGWGALLLLPLTLVFIILFRRWQPYISSIFRKDWVLLALFGTVMAVFLSLSVPAPLPLLYQKHTLEIRAPVEVRNSKNHGTITILSLKSIDGKPIPIDHMKKTGIWEAVDGGLSYTGAGQFSLTFTGQLPPGAILDLQHQPSGGHADLVWDGVSRPVHLYALQSMHLEQVLKGISWRRLPFFQAALVWVLRLLNAWGWFVLAVLLALGIGWLEQITGRSSAIRVLACLLLLAVYIHVKLSITSYDSPTFYRDSGDYAVIAARPLSSAAFWFGERPFTLPLEFKILGVNPANYETEAAKARVAGFQIGFSILSWTILALALASTMRHAWSGVLAFGLALFFSLNYEIGKWDVLLISESISFSLFALLLAGWLWLISPSSQKASSGMKRLAYEILLLVAILYCFARDTNMYFGLMASVLFLAATLMTGPLKGSRKIAAASTALFMILFFINYASIKIGDRWQIHIYDHLAYRIIPDKAALQFFENAGLPVSQKLLRLPKMKGAVYQEMMLYDASMEPVRQWTNEHGMTTYARYLLSTPRFTLIKPLKESAILLNGTGLDYRSPRDGVLPVPDTILRLTSLFFPHFPVWSYVVVWLACMAAGLRVFLRGSKPSGWLLVACLLLTMYPLMFMIWYGNPMEIERHAIQVAVQFRLAAWLVLLFGLDGLISLSWMDRLNRRRTGRDDILPGKAVIPEKTAHP